MPEFRSSVSKTSLKASNSVAMVPGILAKTAILALLWYVITRGQTSAWIIGLPAVALAAMASVTLGRASLPRISLAGLVGFIALFLRESVRGGLDVARRTLAPKLRIQPGFTLYRPRLNDPVGASTADQLYQPVTRHAGGTSGWRRYRVTPARCR